MSDPDEGTSLDLARLSSAGGGGDGAALQKEIRELLSRMFVCVKLALIYDIDNAVMGPPCHRLAEIYNLVLGKADGIAALQLLGDGVYVNKVLVKVDASTFEQGQYLYKVWTKLGVQEIATIAETDGRDWHAFFAVFKQAVGGGDPARLRATPFEKIRLREVQATHSPDTVTVTERFRALRCYAVATIVIKETIAKLADGKRPEPAKVKRAVQDLISAAVQSEPMLLALASLKRHKLAAHHHLANCVVFAVVIGRRLGLSKHELAELGMAAAFHDLGRAFVAGDDERTIAARTVQKLVRIGSHGQAALARVAVADDMRRSPGGGAVRVLAVAHAYDLMTSPGAGHPALLPDEALRVLLREAGRRYDATCVKLFVNAVGVFPVGSLVALSTGETAIVVEAPEDATRASRPRVKVIRDLGGALLDGFIVDLAGDAGAERRILRCVDDEEEQLNTPAFLLG